MLVDMINKYEQNQFAYMIGQNSDSSISELKRMGFSRIDHKTILPEKSYINRYFTKNIL